VSQDPIAALTADAKDFENLVADLDAASWQLPTPAAGWSVTSQVGHLAFIFKIAKLSAAKPEAFKAMTASLAGGFDNAVNAALQDYIHDAPDVLLRRWREERDTSIAALAAVPPDSFVPWLVNPLPPAVLACAGMMELFAHGQDIADAIGVTRTHTDRIQWLCGFAVRVRDFGYEAHKITPPAEDFHFELTGPSGAVWKFGPEEAEQRIKGSAVDFCLLATRRRHRDDLDVSAEGALAEGWLDIAQAYRGPAGAGRRPGQFN
jgi:uncharacterized protein (TIGR03084 family)